MMMDTPSFRTIYRTLKRDVKALRLYIRTYSFVKKCYFQNLTVLDFLKKHVEKNPDDVCFIFENEEWTFKQVDDLSNKVAHSFRLQGYRKGDEVALLMENCPDYVCFWLGLAKIGVVTALINTNLRKESLAHSMNVIDLKGVIFGQSLTETLKNALPFINEKDTATFYCYTRKSENQQVPTFSYKSLNVLLDDASPSPLESAKFKAGFSDKLMYIYTSGTTGLPKAAIVRHSRFLWISGGAKFISQLEGSHTFYNPLPMYHTAGGVLFLGIVLIFGGKMVLRKKFSASNFWKEVVQHKVTVCQYIGEICRYLLNQPKVPEETQHSVWLMFGNGLRPHIWKEFQERFKMKNVIEMYGATEGNANLVNVFGKEGAVGFISRIFSKLYPVFLIKINPETGEIVRDENGLCIRSKPGELGMLVGKVVQHNPLNAFDGYVNSTDTKKKIVRDCFRKGDMVFVSGDILEMDEDGYLYFKDRSGDTFRWKGENISTGEVENTISKVLGLASCIVYGVQIPGTEGRAGMAAIQIDLKNIDFEKLFKHISERLPLYSVPMFIRVSRDLEATGTFKLTKVSFQKQGYNPEEISDPIYFLDLKKKTYVPFTKELYSDLTNGKIRV